MQFDVAVSPCGLAKALDIEKIFKFTGSWTDNWVPWSWRRPLVHRKKIHGKPPWKSWVNQLQMVIFHSKLWVYQRATLGWGWKGLIPRGARPPGWHVNHVNHVKGLGFSDPVGWWTQVNFDHLDDCNRNKKLLGLRWSLHRSFGTEQSLENGHVSQHSRIAIESHESMSEQPSSRGTLGFSYSFCMKFQKVMRRTYKEYTLRQTAEESTNNHEAISLVDQLTRTRTTLSLKLFKEAQQASRRLFWTSKILACPYPVGIQEPFGCKPWFWGWEVRPTSVSSCIILLYFEFRFVDGESTWIFDSCAAQCPIDRTLLIRVFHCAEEFNSWCFDSLYIYIYFFFFWWMHHIFQQMKASKIRAITMNCWWNWAFLISSQELFLVVLGTASRHHSRLSSNPPTVCWVHLGISRLFVCWADHFMASWFRCFRDLPSFDAEITVHLEVYHIYL